MEQILNRGFALGGAAALVSAGLIATTPTAPPMPLPAPSVQHIDIQLTTDVFSALATNINNIFTDTWGALTSLAEFHLSSAADLLSASVINIVAIPQDLILGRLAALTGVSNPDYFGFAGSVYAYDPDVIHSLSIIFNGAIQDISNGVSSLFSLNLVNAFVDFSNAFDSAFLVIPGELIVGPLMALGL